MGVVIRASTEQASVPLESWWQNPCAVLSKSPLNEGNLTLIHIDRSAYFGPEDPLYARQAA